MDHWFSLTSAKTTVVAVFVTWSPISNPILREKCQRKQQLAILKALLTTLAFYIKLFMNDCITHVILVHL